MRIQKINEKMAEKSTVREVETGLLDEVIITKDDKLYKVRFVIDEGMCDYLDIHFYEGMISVHATNGVLIIRPKASNVVELYSEEFGTIKEKP